MPRKSNATVRSGSKRGLHRKSSSPDHAQRADAVDVDGVLARADAERPGALVDRGEDDEDDDGASYQSLAGGATSPSPVDVDEQQPSLVPMTDAEMASAALRLARLCREADEMASDHAAQRSEMAAERKRKREEIAACASTIRQQGR